MRFVLMSDVHLDRSFAWARREVASRRRRALRDAFAAGIRLVDEVDADALLLGGDLYERDRFSPDTRAFVRDRLCALDRPVFVAPGNHDCHDPRSLWAQVDWPEHVTVFADDRLSPVALEDGLTLWGAAHLKPGGTNSFLAGFRADGAGIHLALFHGSLEGGLAVEADTKKPHAPFAADDLERAGIHHAFLGHYHTPRHDERLTYPGNPEPLSFGERGDRGAVEAEVHPDGRVTTTVHDVSRTDVHDLEYDVTGAGSLHDLRAGVGELTRGLTGCARVTLTGSLHPDVELDRDAIAEAAGELDALVVRSGGLLPAYDLDTIRNERTIRGQFLRDVEAAEHLSEEQRRRVLVTGLRALDGRDDLEVG